MEELYSIVNRKTNEIIEINIPKEEIDEVIEEIVNESDYLKVDDLEAIHI